MAPRSQISKWLIAKLSRATSSGEIIREIDGFRFIAISSVVLHHLLTRLLEDVYHLDMPLGGWQGLKQKDPLIWLLSYTWFGVQFFFVISGFVLALPFARSKLAGAPAPSLKHYYLRRLTRIEPPYIIGLVIFMLLLSFFDARWQHRLPNFFASFFYVHNLVYGEMSRIGSIFWSLEVEVQFYLLAPFLALIFAIKPPVARRAMLISWIAAWGFFIPRMVCNVSDRLALSLVCNLQYFLAGFLLAELYLTTDFLRRPKTYLWDGVALVSVAVLGIVLVKYWHGWWLLPFLLVLLYVSLFVGRIGNRLMTHPTIYIIGGMCYTIYLYPVLVIKYSGRHLTYAYSSPDQPLLFALGFQLLLQVPLILIVCGALYCLCEKPFMRYRLSSST